jgi:hypothetical protein
MGCDEYRVHSLRSFVMGCLNEGMFNPPNNPCLFMKEGIVCVVYVDDTIFAGADTVAFAHEIRNLGVSNSEQRHTFQLRNKGEVGAFLGKQMTTTGSNTFTLTQTGLIAKTLEAAHMSDCNGVNTLTRPNPIGC